MNITPEAKKIIEEKSKEAKHFTDHSKTFRRGAVFALTDPLLLQAMGLSSNEWFPCADVRKRPKFNLPVIGLTNSGKMKETFTDASGQFDYFNITTEGDFFIKWCYYPPHPPINLKP